eukprot:2624995-Pyramimonas_sp.AAC.1
MVVGIEESTRLIVDGFALLVKQLDYDVSVFEVRVRQCQTVKGSRFFKEQDLGFISAGPL